MSVVISYSYLALPVSVFLFPSCHGPGSLYVNCEFCDSSKNVTFVQLNNLSIAISIFATFCHCGNFTDEIEAMALTRNGSVCIRAYKRRVACQRQTSTSAWCWGDWVNGGGWFRSTTPLEQGITHTEGPNRLTCHPWKRWISLTDVAEKLQL